MGELTDAEKELMAAKIAAVRAENVALRAQAEAVKARGRIPIKLTDKATYRRATDAACLEAVVRAYQEEGRIGQMLRHYHYKLLTAGLIVRDPNKPNADRNAYNYVGRLIRDARRTGILPWSAVIDPGRRSWSAWSYDSLAQSLRLNTRSVMKVDIWRGQSCKLVGHLAIVLSMR